jgi:hypothetical protein
MPVVVAPVFVLMLVSMFGLRRFGVLAESRCGEQTGRQAGGGGSEHLAADHGAASSG